MGKKSENFPDLVAGNTGFIKGSYHTRACSLFIMFMHLIAKSELTCLLHLDLWAAALGHQEPNEFPCSAKPEASSHVKLRAMFGMRILEDKNFTGFPFFWFIL